MSGERETPRYLREEPLPASVIRFRRACFTAMAVILVPLIVATTWAQVVSYLDAHATVQEGAR